MTTRYSKNREAILECLKNTKTHPTAEWIYDRIKDQLPTVSLGTVYRNLGQLKDAGTIKSMGVVAGEEHFDYDTTPHPHAICNCCGSIEDVELGKYGDQYRSFVGMAAVTSGFEISGIVINGLCSECKPVKAGL